MKLKSCYCMALLMLVFCVSISASAVRSTYSVCQLPVATAVADDNDEQGYVYKAERQYLFGVAVGATDSITYVTDICPVDGMDFDSRLKKPLGLERYTANFREFLNKMGRNGYLCTTFYAKSLKDAVNKLAKVHSKVRKQKDTRLVELSEYEFHYIPTHNIQLQPIPESQDE